MSSKDEDFRRLARLITDQACAGYFPEADAVAMLVHESGRNPGLLRELRTQLAQDPDTLPLCLALLDRAAEDASRPPRQVQARPDASRFGS